MIFRRKKKSKIKVRAMPMPVLIRQAIYDSIFEENAEEIAAMLGLSPVSEDVSQMESEASQERINKFNVLMPLIDAHSDISAKIAAAAYVIQAKEEGKEVFIEGDSQDDLAHLFKIVSMSSAVSCLSTLIGLGLVETKVEEGMHE